MKKSTIFLLTVLLFFGTAFSQHEPVVKPENEITFSISVSTVDNKKTQVTVVLMNFSSVTTPEVTAYMERKKLKPFSYLEHGIQVNNVFALFSGKMNFITLGPLLSPEDKALCLSTEFVTSNDADVVQEGKSIFSLNEIPTNLRWTTEDWFLCVKK